MNTRDIQARLAALGFDPGPIDGLHGPKTDAAIVAFKKSVGLRARPFVGPLTLAALFPADETPSNIPWLANARSILGVHEKRDTARLRKWFDKAFSWVDPREVPWCGAFVATAMRMWKPMQALPDNPLGARNWLKYGQPCTPQLGAVLVFWRVSPKSWQGHVGFYWGEDATHYHVLGGNQSNAVTITRIRKDRLLGARWPDGKAIPEPPKRVILSKSGVPVSENEA